MRRIIGMLALGHRWQRLKFALATCLQDPTLYPLGLYPPFDMDRCTRMFIRNQTLLHWHARSVGAKPLTYLQPFNGVGARPLSAVDAASVAHMRRRVSRDGSTELDVMHDFYRRVAADFGQRGDGAFVDLTTVFNDAPANVYIDQVHCSDIGYDLMARRITRDILEREGLSCADSAGGALR